MDTLLPTLLPFEEAVFVLTDIDYDLYIQGESHKVLQSDSTQTIDHIQKCFRQKFWCSRRPSYWTTLFFYQLRR